MTTALALRETPSEEVQRPLDPTEARVRQIMECMVRCTWTASKAQELADEWGISVSSIGHIVSEASRRIEFVVSESGIDWRSLIVTGVQSIAAAAIEAKDRANALRAFDLLSKIHGVQAPTRVAVSADLSSLSPEELKRRRANVLRALGEQARTDAEDV